MSNLGLYQVFTSVSKKVGGPKVLIGLIATAGYVVLRSVEFSGKEVIKIVKNKKNKTKESKTKYTFIDSGVDDNGLKFNKNDSFSIAVIHDDVVLIEKYNDKNNPYFVSLEWLKKVSDYVEILEKRKKQNE